MLSSISPVGEAARQQRWSLTVAAYVVGSAGAGTATGALLGLLGSAGWGLVGGMPSDGPVLLVVAGLALAGLVLDATTGVPSVHRQVDERWLTTYRGWVYGIGFGAQLGAGVVTIVPASIVWVMWGTALVSGSPLAGALIGLVFGLVRSVPLVAAGRVRTVAALRRTLAAVDRARKRASLVTRLGQLGVAVAAVAIVLR
ncbi:MAG: sulfite exporter TauE/SafE family protein [Actinomycetota bacterium]